MNTSRTLQTSPTRSELLWLLRQSRAPRLRTLREFAEQEVIIPDGPFKGRKFRSERQPYTGLWFDLVQQGLQSKQWNRFFAAGCTESGKTLSCFAIPACIIACAWPIQKAHALSARRATTRY